jgi:hypothetical protein
MAAEKLSMREPREVVHTQDRYRAARDGSRRRTGRGVRGPMDPLGLKVDHAR